MYSYAPCASRCCKWTRSASRCRRCSSRRPTRASRSSASRTARTTYSTTSSRRRACDASPSVSLPFSQPHMLLPLSRTCTVHCNCIWFHSLVSLLAFIRSPVFWLLISTEWWWWWWRVRYIPLSTSVRLLFTIQILVYRIYFIHTVYSQSSCRISTRTSCSPVVTVSFPVSRTASTPTHARANYTLRVLQLRFYYYNKLTILYTYSPNSSSRIKSTVL